MRHLICLLFTLVAALPATAATLAERSPFTQGHWWNPARSGSGFDLFSAGDQVALIWYTHDAQGAPVWYIAQGNQAGLGTASWPLMKYRWANGRIAAGTVVGTARLQVRHAEGIDLQWTLDGQSGSWPIEPLRLSGITNEVDRGGHWFDPAASGWGLTVSEQGNAFGSVLYAYDPAGNPTWVAGFHRGGTRVELFETRGACPSCAYFAATTRSAGRLTFDFQSEYQATLQSELTTAFAPGVNVQGARLVQLSRSASSRAADRQLANFQSEPALKAYLDAGIQAIRPYSGGIEFSPAPAATAPAFSTTNLQEAGVDEADLVKSDGRYVYAFEHALTGPRPTLRIAESLNDGASLRFAGSVNLAFDSSRTVSHAGLYLHGTRLVTLAGTVASPSYFPISWVSSSAWARGSTEVEILDATAPQQPVSRWRVQIDGHLITSRRVGDRLYLVLRHVPFLEGFAYGTTLPSAVSANQALLAATPLSGLLPKMRVNGAAAVAAVAAPDVFIPPQGARPPLADLIVVVAIDIPGERVAQTLAVVGTVDTAYASTSHLYLAGGRYDVTTAGGGILPREPEYPVSDIHRIRLGDTAMQVSGSATIEGTLGFDVDKAAFRLSEYQGRLRALTSTGTNMWGASQRNRLTILEPSTAVPGLLKTVSWLPNERRPETLGKPGEQLYGARFVGDRLYAVTFKKIDPLYVVDLADSADPKIAGALELPGFSDYLHPLPGNLLLGFGKEARPADVTGDGQFAWYQGLQLTLFDTTNAAQPREIQRVLVGKRGSDSALLRSHHAFSELVRADGTRTITIPARIHDGTVPVYGTGDWATYPWAASGLLRWELQGSSPANARLVAAASLTTHSYARDSDPGYWDPGMRDGRAVQLKNGAVFVGTGRFWNLDAAGNATGPY